MSTTPTPSLEDLRRLNESAALGMPEADLERLHSQIAAAVVSVRRLLEADLADVEPATIFRTGGLR